MRSLNIEGVDHVKKKKEEPCKIIESSNVLDIIDPKEIDESFMFLAEKMHEQDNGDPDLRRKFKKARLMVMLLKDIMEDNPDLKAPQKWVDEISGSWYLYLLRCGDGKHYVGISKNTEERLSVHNKGKASRYTRSRLPVDLIAAKGPYTESSAKRWERKVKRFPWDRKMRFFGIDPTRERFVCMAIEDQMIRERVRRKIGH